MSGASAAPLDSMKYWIAIAVLLISGSVTSFTVEVTFGLAIGMKRAVTASAIPKNNFSLFGMLMVT